ncbi:MAG: quinolinate synthase NadA [Proteobacteria bacterium]|nr:quinolinate synthase NadA [Pseudomonadota bacterium]MBU1741550.1 quinolinate synthase NadA [Pseudomonadota bacterium]
MSTELLEAVRALLQEKNALLLAHNYQRPEVQDAADLTGDSLGLSMEAARTEAEVIVFAGVHFMAETAAILSPQKTVILPERDAGCPMADMITPEKLRAKKAELPGVPVVTYVNSSAAVKAESDVCCTSANVVSVVKSRPEDHLLLTPDQNLAQYAQRHTNKKLDFWPGYCPTHQKLTPADVLRAREAHPGALVMAHPECRPEVLDLADAIKSTSGMLTFAAESDAEEFIVGTETGLLHPLQKNNPTKKFYPASKRMVCPNMKLTTLASVKIALELMTPVIEVPEDVAAKARLAVERMLAVPRD